MMFDLYNITCLCLLMTVKALSVRQYLVWLLSILHALPLTCSDVLNGCFHLSLSIVVMFHAHCVNCNSCSVNVNQEGRDEDRNKLIGIIGPGCLPLTNHLYPVSDFVTKKELSFLIDA